MALVPSGHVSSLSMYSLLHAYCGNAGGLCLDLPRLKQIHARMLRLDDFSSDPRSATHLLTAYCCAASASASAAAAALSSSPVAEHLHGYALRLFDQMPQPNTYSWNTLIRAHASGRDPEFALLLFSRMLLSTTADKFTYPFAIKAAGELPAASGIGAAIHAMVAKSPYRSDVFILNSLISFYAACGRPDLAFRMFDNIPKRDVVSWNSIITAFAQAGRCDEALDLFRNMEEEEEEGGVGIRPNQITVIGALSACEKKGDIQLGKLIYSSYMTEHNRINECCLILNNALLRMYAKCGCLEEAMLLFDSMTERDYISWTTMVFGFAKSGDVDAARRIFDAMPSHDRASWNAMISGYGQNSQPKEALALFHEMQCAGIEPDQVTLVSALSACAQLGAMDLGCWIHTYIEKNNLDLNFHLTTSLIDMYSKCGDLEKAHRVFGSAEERDVCVWSAMIGGLAMHGRGEAALELFSQMQEANIKPNTVTFTSVLCACSHSGLVEEGRLYFTRMLPTHGIAPQAEHYACMVDILGRAGLLEEARELVENMPMPPPASVWGALLGASVLHRNIELAEHACKHLLELEPGNDGAYVLLSNLYAKSRNWGRVSKLRKLMKDASLRKEPGFSSIEVHGVIHEFLMGDTSHPLSERIYLKLDEITSRLIAAGYAPNWTQLLQDIEEDDGKDLALCLHSEKLAIAFGLISTSQHTPIRITKNIRICDDCHKAAKLVSSIYNRDIILRDRYRFHHFRNGHCSCMDYW